MLNNEKYLLWEFQVRGNIKKREIEPDRTPLHYHAVSLPLGRRPCESTPWRNRDLIWDTLHSPFGHDWNPSISYRRRHGLSRILIKLPKQGFIWWFGDKQFSRILLFPQRVLMELKESISTPFFINVRTEIVLEFEILWNDSYRPFHYPVCVWYPHYNVWRRLGRNLS